MQLQPRETPQDPGGRHGYHDLWRRRPRPPDLGSHTAGGGTISYSYDPASALASETDAHGTTNYHYDDAHQLSYLIHPQGSGTAMMLFDYDNAGRRTDTWLQTNATHSTWGGHSHTTYDGSGRVTHVVAQQGPATSSTTVLDQEYCLRPAPPRPAAAPPRPAATGRTSSGERTTTPARRPATPTTITTG